MCETWAGAAADVDDLLHGGRHGLRLIADVRGVDAAMAAHDPGQFDQLVEGRVGAGRVGQAAGHPEAAVRHGLLGEVDHRRHFTRARRAVVVSHGGHAEVAVADEGGGVGGDALRERTKRAAVERDRQVRVRVDVDEAGTHDPARRIDGAPGGARGEVADRGDPVAVDGDVALPAGRSAAVDQRPVRDQEVVHETRLRRAADRQRRREDTTGRRRLMGAATSAAYGPCARRRLGRFCRSGRPGKRAGNRVDQPPRPIYTPREMRK